MRDLGFFVYSVYLVDNCSVTLTKSYWPRDSASDLKVLPKINEEDNDRQGWRCARSWMASIVINFSSQETTKSFILSCSSSYCCIPNYFKKTQRCGRERLYGDMDCNIPRRLAIFSILSREAGSDVVSNCIMGLFSFYWLLHWNPDIRNLYIAKPWYNERFF